MNNNYTIMPSTRTILGSTGKEKYQSSTTQRKSPQEESLWGKIKSVFRKTGSFFKQVLSFIKNEIVPIASSVGILINALNNLFKNMGRVPCAA